ncbi:MAG: hypothetical protein ACI82Z_000479 [Cellvibrionaceae bacterium]|jgi:hypothetical protein
MKSLFHKLPFAPVVSVLILPLLLVSSFSLSNAIPSDSLSDADKAEALFIVDCLLPGKIKRLGRKFTYVAARRPIKTSASDCEIRGGEYVAFDRSDYRTALKIWLPQAKLGDSEAQTYVGEIYEKGLGVKPNYELAAEWYRLAAEQDHSPAQINLGYLYEKGLGVPEDHQQALNWYRKASGLPGAVTLDRGSIPFGFDPSESQIPLESTLPSVSPLPVQNQQVTGDQKNEEITRLQRELAKREAELADQQQQRQKFSKAQTEELTLLQRQLAQREFELSREERERQAISEKKNAELARLKAQLAQREADLNRQKQNQQAVTTEQSDELVRLQQELAQREQDLARREQERQSANEAQNEELARLQKQLAQREADLASQAEDLKIANRTQGEELARLQTQLAQREADLLRQQESRQKADDAQNQELTRLQNELSEREAELKRLQAQIESQQAGQLSSMIEGPIIEIIDPPLGTQGTRGFEVVEVSSSVRQKDIIGKLANPANLLSLTVNDRKEVVDENGLFSASITLRDARTPIKIVAINKQGKRRSIEFQLKPDEFEAAEEVVEPALNFGKYHALLIGNQQYSEWPNLETPVNDVQVAAKILEEQYGFETKVMINATRFDILQALNEYRKQLTENDNFLIYYAGHGHYEEVIKRGYWVPVDGNTDSNVNWVPTFAITDALGAMSAKHILVISDSCYSGALTRSGVAARLEAGRTAEAEAHRLKVIAEKSSRTVLASGDLQPVLDIGSDNHSLFAKAFLDVLRENTEIIEGMSIWLELRALVLYAAAGANLEQNPQYAPLKYSGHGGGDFLFVPTSLQQ